MNNKKGISAVVATVLIVLITVAAVTIIWASVSSLIDKNLDTGTACFDTAGALSVDTAVGFTCYNGTDAQVRIERKNNNIEIKSLDIIISVDGESKTFNQSTVPDKNGALVYERLAVATTDDSVVKAAVAPVIELDGELITCQANEEQLISVCA